MKMQLSRLLPAGALLLLGLASCKKNDVPQPTSLSQSTPSALLMNATNTISGAGDQQSAEVSDVLGSNSIVANDSSSCRMVTFSPSKDVYPHLKTVDFGTGCKGVDGITRSGKKLITVYADWKTAPAGTLVAEATFSDFWVDSINVSGNVQFYIDTAASSGPLAVKIVTNKTFTSATGNTSTYIATSYWMQTAGDSTTTQEDNVYQITSSASGTEVLSDSTMLTWTANTDPQHPIIKMGNCNYRSAGALQIQLTLAQGTMYNEYLDYGNGDCDNIATLSIDGGTAQQVTLPLFFWPINL